MKLSNFIKYNKLIFNSYYYIMSMIIKILKFFIKANDKLILFNSFAGRNFDDSPKAIFETMKADERFRDYKFVWAFHEPDKFTVEGAEKIKTNSFNYFKTALSARVWITNSSVERGLDFTGKKTLYLNTWHGSPIKAMGSDIPAGNQSFRSKGKNKTDLMNTQSYFEADIFSRCFGIPRDKFIEVGLPRNDELVNYSESKRYLLKKKLDLPLDKKVILYCPTFREYEKDENYGVVFASPINFDKWKNLLGEKYVLLIRAHYEVSKIMEIKNNSFVKNMSNYPSLNDLMIASDILISDYSSIYFDYSIMDKCMIHFTYDYDVYESKRGMYFDIREYINGSDSEDDIINILLNLQYEKEVQKTILFREKFMNFYGDASKKTVDCIADNILMKKEKVI